MFRGERVGGGTVEDRTRKKERKKERKKGGKVLLLGFYGISHFVCYLTPNPLLCKFVLFKTGQFSLSTQFAKNISI